MKRLFITAVASCFLMANVHANDVQPSEQKDDTSISVEQVIDFLNNNKASIIEQGKNFLMTVGGYALVHNVLSKLYNTCDDIYWKNRRNGNSSNSIVTLFALDGQKIKFVCSLLATLGIAIKMIQQGKTNINYGMLAGALLELCDYQAPMARRFI